MQNDNVKVCDRTLCNHLNAAGFKFYEIKTKVEWDIPAMFERLRRIFNRFSFHLVSSLTKNPRLHLLPKKQDAIPNSLHSGIYEIRVQLTTGLLISISYIGMTK